MAKEPPSYLPDRADVWYRADAVRWMAKMGWEDSVMNSIMYDDTPTIDVVERLVRVHGADKAYEIIRRMNQ